jgi:hypothetical protein
MLKQTEEWFYEMHNLSKYFIGNGDSLGMVFWDVTSCGGVIFTLKMGAAWSYETLKSDHVSTRRHNPEDQSNLILGMHHTMVKN